MDTSSQKLTRPLLWLMTIATGLIVANLYYNQPLLSLIAQEFKTSETAVGKIAMLTQMGYAFGLLVIVPLGDKTERKKLILYTTCGAMFMLLAMAVTPYFHSLYVISFFIGCLSVVPQLFVPMVAEYSHESKRTQNIGMVMSGLLIGILASRMLSGIIGDHLGWRSMFYMATALMFCTAFVLYLKLPDSQPNFKGNYASLLQSVFHFARTEPLLQLASFRGAMGFGAVSAIFTTLIFHLEEAPFFADASVAGAFGLIGAVGAMAAASVGKLTVFFTRNTIISFAIVVILISWLFSYFAGYTYWGLIIGFILIDFGLQSMHIMNQTDFFAINIKAASRLNTVYMVSYFVGGSLGTLLGTIAWQYYGWTGVCVVGTLFSLFSLISHLLFCKKVRKKQL